VGPTTELLILGRYSPDCITRNPNVPSHVFRNIFKTFTDKKKVVSIQIGNTFTGLEIYAV